MEKSKQWTLAALVISGLVIYLDLLRASADGLILGYICGLGFSFPPTMYSFKVFLEKSQRGNFKREKGFGRIRELIDGFNRGPAYIALLFLALAIIVTMSGIYSSPDFDKAGRWDFFLSFFDGLVMGFIFFMALLAFISDEFRKSFFG